MGSPDVPPTSNASHDPASIEAAHAREAIREAVREEYFGGARLIFSDARVAYMLLNDARSRTIARIFGISGENSALVTMIALGLLAESVRAGVARALTAPGDTDLADAVIGVSVLRESARALAGGWSAESPMFVTLVAVAMVGHVARPAVAGAIRGIKASSHRARADFGHRYGHIIRPSHLRG
jgi:hypothetical protein